MKELSIYKVPEDIVEKAKAECERLKCNFVNIFRKSNEPGDKHLFVVIGEKITPLYEDRPYCVWTFNTTDMSFHNGDYDVSDGKALSLTLHRVYNSSTFPDF